MSDIEPQTEFSEPSFQLTQLWPVQRSDLVNLTTTGDVSDLLQVANLELSALGANVDLSGAWNHSKLSPITSWNELAQGGRSVRTVLVSHGYLFPLGHKASLIQVFQRAIGVDPPNASSDPANYPVAYLQYLTSIHVGQAGKSYPAVGQPFGPPVAAPGSGTTDWPFTTVRMITLDSGLIDPFPSSPTLGTPSAFWPTVTINGVATDVLWNFVARDAAGHDVSFSMPLAFVLAGSEFGVGPGTAPAKWAAAYNPDAKMTMPAHATWSVTGGSPLQFAPTVPVAGATGTGAAASDGGTTHPTLSITLGAATTGSDPNLGGPGATPSPATTVGLTAAGQPNFYPTISSVRVRLQAADLLTGADFPPKPSGTDWAGVGGVGFSFFPQYIETGVLTSGFSPNPQTPQTQNAGAVYLQALDSLSLALPSGSVGALATPVIGLSGLSAAAGIVGGELATYAQQAQADVADYFSDVGAQLLGALPLSSILAASGFQTPTITTQLDPANGVITIAYQLSTLMTSYPNTGVSAYPLFVPDADGSGQLNLQATFSCLTSLNQSAAQASTTSTISGSLDPFWLYLLGYNDPNLDFLQLHFESLTFKAQTGHAPTVHVNLDQVTFAGTLQLVNALEQFLGNLGGSGMSIAVEASQITASISLAVPDLEVGIFNLSGLSFTGSLQIPLTSGQAVARFAFASQDHPFTLTVACFGGGGFLTVATGFSGIQSVQAGLEFGGQLGFDIGIASGSLSLMAGIYYTYASVPDGQGGQIELSGFVRVSGRLTVLGIVTISASLELQLNYLSPGSVSGQASLTVGVSVCGFSKSVSITVTQTFTGSGAAGAAIPQARRNSLRAATRDLTPAATGTAAATTGPWATVVPQARWRTYCAAFATGTQIVH